MHIDYPLPYVPRNRTYEVRGRIDALGRELEPLVESDVAAAIDYFRRCEVQAIAVSLLWSIVNPAPRAASVLDTSQAHGRRSP